MPSNKFEMELLNLSENESSEDILAVKPEELEPIFIARKRYFILGIIFGFTVNKLLFTYMIIKIIRKTNAADFHLELSSFRKESVNLSLACDEV